MTNPYQTPEGQLTDDDQAYGEINFFSPSSRINRLRYWAHSMLFSLLFFVVAAVGGALMASVSMVLGGIILGVAYIALLAFSFVVMIQRLHDLNKSGWMCLLAIVPLANIYLVVLLIFFKGTPGRNDYGLQTPPNKMWHWVLAFIMPVLMVGILAAVAIPAYQDYLARVAADAAYDQQPTDDYSEGTPADDMYQSGEADQSMDGEPSTEDTANEESTDDMSAIDDEESAILDESETTTP